MPYLYDEERTHYKAQQKCPVYFTDFTSRCCHTWKTFGADIRLASAEDRVAETIPAIIIGPNADVTCITWRKDTEMLFKCYHKLIINYKN